MMVRFMPRLPTKAELTACSRALCARRMESRSCQRCAGALRPCAHSEAQAERTSFFGTVENLVVLLRHVHDVVCTFRGTVRLFLRRFA